MSIYKLIILSIIFVLTSFGCAVAPFSEGQTGRSLGKGQLEVSSSVLALEDEKGVNSVPLAKLSYGVSESIDFSLKTELQTLSLGGKFSVINNQKRGYSLAPTFNLVLSGGLISYQFGVVKSYKWKSIEPYMSLKYNLAHIDPSDFDKGFFKSSPELNFNFVTHTYGLRVNVNRSLALGPEVTIIEPPTGSTEFNHDTIVGFQLYIKP